MMVIKRTFREAIKAFDEKGFNAIYDDPEAYEFVNREGVLVRPAKVKGKDVLLPVGKAYSFFDCDTSKQEIERELPRIRELARTPSHLELSLIEVNDLEKSRGVGPDLLQFIRQNEIYATFPSKYKDQMKTAKPIKMTDLKYMLTAAYPNVRNEEAANELGDVMNEIYSRYGNGEPFNVAITCKIDGKYLFKD